MSDIIPDGDVKREIVDLLTDEIATAEDERVEFLERVKKWERQREARPEEAVKNYPWKKASNIATPLSASNINGIYATNKMMIDKKQPLIDITALDPKKEGRGAEVLQKFLNILMESRNHTNIRAKNNSILYDCISHGTQFVKVPWEVEKWSFKRRDRLTGGMEQVTQTVRNTPSVIPIRLPDFLTRSYFTDLQKATWYSTISRLLPHELSQRVAHDIYDADSVDKVMETPRTTPTDEEAENLERRGLYSAGVEVHDIYETHLYWDLDDDGFVEDIVVWFHPPTGEILRSEFNDLGKRDIVRIPYFNLPGQLYGMGVAWMCEYLQDEHDFLHNSFNDALHLSTLGMLATRRGSGIGPNLEVRPGLVVQTDGKPSEDIMPFKLPGPDPTSLQREMMIKAMAERFTGYNDYLAGQESEIIKSRATLGGTMFLAQQGNQIQRSFSENISQGYGEIAENMVYQLVRNREQVERDLIHLLPEEDRPILMQVLSINPEEIPLRFAFQMKPTDPENTKEAERNGIVTLSQLYITFGEKITNLLALMSNPMLPMDPRTKEVLSKFVVGGTNMMERILTNFGYDDTRPYIPDFSDISMMLKAVEQMRGMQVEAISRGQTSGGGGGAPVPSGGSIARGAVEGRPPDSGSPQVPMGGANEPMGEPPPTG